MTLHFFVLQLLLSYNGIFCEETVSEELYDYTNINLPEEHLSLWFGTHKFAAEVCRNDSNCPYKRFLDGTRCWGYEKNCDAQHRYSYPTCDGNVRYGTIQSKADQEASFYESGDFGYIKNRRESMKVLCQPKSKNDSYLACSDYTRYCRAKNIYFDFKNLKSHSRKTRYEEDVFRKGEIGGHCKMDEKALKEMGEHKSALQSWYAELQEYTSLDFYPADECDMVIDKPTYVVKLDATVSMYHHYCDFVNMYATQHMNNSFNTDAYILNWDTSAMDYRDHFEVSWRAFSDYSVLLLRDFDQKKVCFRDVVFALLPRMRFGMYYNMPLIQGCAGSGFFHAFNKHIVHRLLLTQHGPILDTVRVTMLSRTTKYRKMLNENELANALKTDSRFNLTLIDFNFHMPFTDQIALSHNTDVLIGMHGSGLTHMLYQPDWAVVFEIYNCEDRGCYSDLARLRGIKYMTWEKQEKLFQEDEGHHPTLGAHAKFTNYAFDVEEFMRLMIVAYDHVVNHPAYLGAIEKKTVEEHHETHAQKTEL